MARMVEASRAETGCLEYSYAEDLQGNVDSGYLFGNFLHGAALCSTQRSRILCRVRLENVFLENEGFREGSMPRRELFTPVQREELLAFPAEEVDLIRNYTFSAHDLAVIRRCRGNHNRLGFSVQLCYLRFPGRLLGLDEVPYPPILGMAAAQLKVPTGAWNFYAEREETRREHLLELQEHFGFQTFTRAHYRQFASELAALSDQTHQGMLLAGALIEALRRAKIIIPGVPVIERLCAAVLLNFSNRSS
jgi:hypothetical protein